MFRRSSTRRKTVLQISKEPNENKKVISIRVTLQIFVLVRSSQWFNPGGNIWLKNLTICVLSNHNSHQTPTLLVKMRPMTREISKGPASGLVRGFSFRVHFHFLAFCPRRRCFLKLLLMVQIEWKIIGNNSLMHGSKLYTTLPHFYRSNKGL